VSRPSHHAARPLDGAAAAARATLPADDAARFDRLTATVLASPTLGPALRGLLPGPAGVRWLHGEGLPAGTRPAALTTEQWLSLFRGWHGSGRTASGGAPEARTRGGRPTRGGHGHAPGAQAAPRWF
jgi:hypothetical protein